MCVLCLCLYVWRLGLLVGKLVGALFRVLLVRMFVGVFFVLAYALDGLIVYVCCVVLLLCACLCIC